MSFKLPQTIKLPSLIVNKIQVHGNLNENGIASVQIHLIDEKGKHIPSHLIPNIPGPTKAQLLAMNATTALAGETITAWIQRAAQPYITTAFGLTPISPTGTTGPTGSSGGMTGATGPSESAGIPGIVGPGIPH